LSSVSQQKNTVVIVDVSRVARVSQQIVHLTA